MKWRLCSKPLQPDRAGPGALPCSRSEAKSAGWHQELWRPQGTHACSLSWGQDGLTTLCSVLAPLPATGMKPADSYIY